MMMTDGLSLQNHRKSIMYIHILILVLLFLRVPFRFVLTPTELCLPSLEFGKLNLGCFVSYICIYVVCFDWVCGWHGSGNGNGR